MANKLVESYVIWNLKPVLVTLIIPALIKSKHNKISTYRNLLVLTLFYLFAYRKLLFCLLTYVVSRLDLSHGFPMKSLLPAQTIQFNIENGAERFYAWISCFIIRAQSAYKRGEIRVSVATGKGSVRKSFNMLKQQKFIMLSCRA